jgi:hypothetical protein
MNQEHFNSLKVKRAEFLKGKNSDKFIIESWNDIDKRNQIKAVDFIEDLISEGVDIERINTNDWNSCPQPKVYVYCNAYKRFSEYDLNNAVKVARALDRRLKA